MSLLRSAIKISKQQMASEKHYEGLQELRRRSHRLLLLNGLLHGFIRGANYHQGGISHVYSLKDMSFIVDEHYSLHKSPRSVQVLR